MAELRLVGNSIEEGKVSITAHLEPEGDGTHEKVIAQTKIDGFILPPGTKLEFVEGVFTPEQQEIIDNLDRRIRALEERVPDASSD